MSALSGRGYLGTKVKGASILARLQHIRDAHGEQTLERVLELMPENEAELLRGQMLPSTQYPLEVIGHLDEAVAKVIKPGDPVAVFRDLGRASAQANLQGIHKTFLRGGTPHEVLIRFPAVRRTYYSDGDASYEKTGEYSGVFRVEGAKSHARADCESTAGYFERAIELVGARHAEVVLTRCRTKGDDRCEFSCRWRVGT